MSDSLKSILKALGFAIIGSVVLYLVYKSNNAAYLEDCAQKGIPDSECSLIDKVVSDVKSANYFWVFVSLILFTLSNVSRALRWHIMLEPMGYKPKFYNSLSAILIAYLSNLGLPRSGEFVRAGILSKYEGYPADELFGTIILDRIVDVIMLLILIVLTMLLSYTEFYGYIAENLDLSAKFANLSGTHIIIGLGVVLFIFGILAKFKDQIIQSKLGSKVASLLAGLKDGVMSITKLRQPWLFVAHTIFIWFCYFAMTYVVFFAFEPTAHLGPVAGLVIFMFGTLGIVFPSPGGMGSYHYLVGEGLALYGIESADAFSFANIIFFSVQLLCNVLLGILAFIMLPILNRKVK